MVFESQWSYGVGSIRAESCQTGVRRVNLTFLKHSFQLKFMLLYSKNLICCHICLSRDLLQVSLNGLITFGTGSTAYLPHQVPLGFTGIAAYFADVAPICGDNSTGNVFYRLSNGECRKAEKVWYKLRSYMQL
jgi:hypothetical protein